ncbi:MAG: hypothetical protein K0V04_38610 [Deltaproteobacteria bacterium]|nr:hypothetical protein [Deltaproteobacteria bacterium]
MVLSLASLMLSLAFAGPGQLLSNPEAQAKLREAQAAFEAEDFQAAAAAVEAAYIIEPEPMLLYPWAQAERSLGNCSAAVELYQQFLDSDPAEEVATIARDNRDTCQEQLDEDAAAAAAAEAEIIEDEIIEDDVIEDEPAPVVASVTPKDDEPKAKAWYTDPVGGALVGVGVVGVGVGAGLMGAGSGAARKAGDQGTHNGYLGERDRATGLRNGGAIALSIGGALIVGGVVRYLLVAKKNKSQATAWHVAPGLSRRWSGVSIGRRF